CAGRAGCPKPDLVHGLVLPALGILRSCVGRSTRAARTRPGSAHAPWSPTARLCVDRAPACQLPLLVTRLGPAALRSALPAHHRCGTGLVSRSAAGTLVDLRHLSRRARKHLVCPGLRIPTSTRSCRRPTPCANGPHGCNGGGLAAHRSRRYSLAGRRPTDAVLPSPLRVDVCCWCSRVPTSMAETSARLSRRDQRSPVRAYARSARAWDDVARPSLVCGRRRSPHGRTRCWAKCGSS